MEAEPAIYVFFAGREFRVDAGDLSPAEIEDDRELRRALARYLGVTLDRLGNHMLHRHVNGEITLRPRSVFDR